MRDDVMCAHPSMSMRMAALDRTPFCQRGDENVSPNDGRRERGSEHPSRRSRTAGTLLIGVREVVGVASTRATRDRGELRDDVIIAFSSGVPLT
jgi:hypothetical protein